MFWLLFVIRPTVKETVGRYLVSTLQLLTEFYNHCQS